jgi:hypothetical protein
MGALLVLAWPPNQDRSLAIKVVNWLADPGGTLHGPPEIILYDEHANMSGYEAERAEYERLYAESPIFRMRLRLKGASSFFSPVTDRQVLMGLGVLGMLFLWRLGS